jgi:tRNA(Ile)-lysidine synthase
VSAAEAARPISAVEATRLFHPLAQACALVLAVSGGPDSTALLVLAARWRGTRKKAPKLLAVTIDHGLRPQSAHEARSVQRLARSLGVPHRILRWEGRKPRTGVQEAARAARYRLLAAVARTAKADHILTAHTLDDQAETVLIRMSRGSGITGLGAMKEVTPLPVARSARRSPDEAKRNPGRCSRIAPSRVEDARERAYGSMRATAGEQLLLVRPLLEIPKARLIATLERAGIEYADDISNRDPRFARARWRDVMPALAREGLDAPRIALFARRLQRAEIALESAVDVAATDVSEGAWGNSWENAGPIVLDAEKFLLLPAEIALRLLGRAIAHAGDEGSPRLGKLETLYGALYAAKAPQPRGAPSQPKSDVSDFGDLKMPNSGKPELGRSSRGEGGGEGRSTGVRLRRTLAGALVTLTQRRLMIERAPPRSHRGAPP